MAVESVLCIKGGRTTISCESVACPGCGTLISPQYLSYDQVAGVLFCKCPVRDCETHFLLRVSGSWVQFIPNHPMKTEEFSDIVRNISSRFNQIYNESYAAEQMGLMEICGVGYRKALEFLIKDYVMEGKDEDTQEKIKRMQLAKCIEEYVTDMNVMNVSKRAVWIGNDETHYVRKWEEKDVKDLKGLIKLTIRWIEQEKETEALLEDMPEGR